jgi:hypothetical protein
VGFRDYAWGVYEMRQNLPSPPQPQVGAIQQVTPANIAKYLRENGWLEVYNFDGVYYRRDGYDRDANGYFTWEQAVAYNLIKPFL